MTNSKFIYGDVPLAVYIYISAKLKYHFAMYRITKCAWMVLHLKHVCFDQPGAVLLAINLNSQCFWPILSPGVTAWQWTLSTTRHFHLLRDALWALLWFTTSKQPGLHTPSSIHPTPSSSSSSPSSTSAGGFFGGGRSKCLASVVKVRCLWIFEQLP